jgi:hypothetical protein
VVTLDAAKTVVATFERIVHQLTVTRVGAGTVSSTPGGIYCGADCEEGIDRGTVVTLTPTPDAGAVFSGWTGACSGNGACTIPMDGAKSVTARFEASATATHLLTATTAGPGVVSSVPLGLYCGAVCASSFPGGTVITLTATPAPGASFTGWSGACSGSGACAVTLSAAVSVGASFEASATPPVTLTVNRGGNARGTVISTPAGIYCGVACSTTFTQGTAVTLTATPDAGAGFSGWGGACTGKGACTFTPSADQTVTASFDSYQLTVTQSGSGRVTSSVAGIDCGTDCGEWYPIGTSLTLTATPLPGFVFIRWGGACSGNGPCTLALGSDQTASATFGATVTVVPTGDGGGTVTSSPQGISCGTTCNLAVTEHTWLWLYQGAPSVGSTFGGWEGAGCSGLGDCRIWIDGPKTVNARYNLASYTLTVTKSGAGSGSVTANPAGISCGTDCTQSYPAQTTVSLTATPFPGSLFGGWSGACYYYNTTGNTCTVTMAAAGTIGASFVPPVTVTVTRVGTGTGSVTSYLPGIDCGADCTEQFAQGNNVTLYATPAAGSQFSKWTAGPCLNLTTNYCTWTASAAVTLTAEFLPATLVGLTVTKSGTGGGSVSSNPAGIDCGTDCNEQVAQNSYVELVATPATGSLFSKWATAPCLNSTYNHCNVYLPAAMTVGAEFQPARTLTVTASGNGRVNSQGIDCGDDCSEVLPQGKVVTLVATPEQNYYFVGWGGACSGTADCTLTINGDKSVTATFSPAIPLTVTVSSLSYGGVVVVPGGAVCLTECVYYFKPGTAVTLTGATTGEAQFDQWAGDCNTTDTCLVTMSEPRAVTAMFKFRVSVSITGDDIGYVYLNGCGTLRVGSNPQTSCYAHIGESMSFGVYATGSVTWTGCDEVVSTARTYASCNFTVTGPRSLTLTTRGASRFIVSKTGDATGTVVSYPAGISCGTDCTEDFLIGSTVTLTAVPETGALFAGWGSLCAFGTTCTTVTLPANQGGRALTAQFGFPRVLTVSHIGTGGGTVSGIGISCGTDCSETYVGGTSITLTATPGSGSTFAGWSGACTGTGSCVVMMDAAKTVTATFN